MFELAFLKKRILNWIDFASKEMPTVQESLNLLQRCKYYLEGTSGRYALYIRGGEGGTPI